MISEAQNHCWRPMLIVMHTIRHGKRQAQSMMGPIKIVIKDLQAHQRIPGRISFGKRVCLAGQGIESIPQRTIEPFQVDGSSRSDTASHRGTDLNRQEVSMPIMMLDRLRQRNGIGDDQLAPSPFATTRLGLAIGVLQNARRVFPAIALTRKASDGGFVARSYALLA